MTGEILWWKKTSEERKPVTPLQSMVEELEIGLENLGLQDEDVEIADADADSSNEEEMAA